MSQIEIPLHEEFNDHQGRFVDYDTYQPNQATQLGLQKHVDIRSFVQNDTLNETPIVFNNLKTMTAMDALTMQDLEGAVPVRRGEHWTTGSVGKQTDRNNWNGLTLTCAAGVTSTSSILTT